MCFKVFYQTSVLIKNYIYISVEKKNILEKHNHLTLVNYFGNVYVVKPRNYRILGKWSKSVPYACMTSIQ